MRQDVKELVILARTMDYEKLIPLFVEAGLEINKEEKEPEGLILCIEIVEKASEKLIGGAALVYNKNVYVIKALAVEDSWRGRGLGRRLVGELMKVAVQCGADKIYLNAKIPDFYKKIGFHTVMENEAPKISDCARCPQYHNGCEPEIMMIKI